MLCVWSRHYTLLKETSSSFHIVTIFTRSKSTSIEGQSPSIDLSLALRHTSKLKVTSKDLKTLDKNNYDNKNSTAYPRAYEREINENVLSPAIREYIRTNEKAPSQVKEKKHEKEDKGKTYSHSKKQTLEKLKQSVKESSGKLAPHPKKSNLNPQFKKVFSEMAQMTSEIAQVSKPNPADIPKLAHNLDKTLFSPGVHFLQDPRTRVYNFTPHLKSIVKYDEFNFDAINSFVDVSKDDTLLNIASKNGKKYFSSTSSMTAVMKQFYVFLNNYSPASTDRFPFPKFSGFSERAPASVLVIPKGKNSKTNEVVYAIESDKSSDNEILLSAMGHCLETFLTTEEHEFEKYSISQATNKKAKADIEKIQKASQNVYNYASYGDFLMRSQLDCYDERLPGNGTFDLKTRAVCAVRYDMNNPDLSNSTYQVWKLKGDFESFEREFNDLIKTGALLKYAFQAKIGQMDGIFLAYHNINTFFGFQYLPLSEIENIFFSHNQIESRKHYVLNDPSKIEDDLPSYVSDVQFKMTLTIWQNILKVIIDELNTHEKYKNTAFRLVVKSVESNETSKQRLQVFAVPLNSSQVREIQSFSTEFKTSFKENITTEERYSNLAKHQKHLEDFNKKSTETDIGVLSYYVEAWHLFGDSKFCFRERHPYPRNKEQPWFIRYNIIQCPKDSKKYLDLVSIASSQLTSRAKENQKEREIMSDTTKSKKKNLNVFRVYNAVGKERVKKWARKDSSAVLYEPRKLAKASTHKITA